MKMILIIAAGGAFGAVARHLVNNPVTALFGDGIPWGIPTANVAGSFAMGVLAGASELAWSPSQKVRTFIVVGFLGAFTIFSTFSLQVAHLYARGQTALAALYLATSVLLAVGALLAGVTLVKGSVL